MDQSVVVYASYLDDDDDQLYTIQTFMGCLGLAIQPNPDLFMMCVVSTLI